MPIICFFGPDGSGKTTLANRLAKKLSDKGFNIRLSWMRGTHTFASMLASILSRINAFNGLDNPYYMMSIPKPFRRPWQLIEFVSVLPILIVKFLLPNILGYTVIAERYLPDFIAWVTTTTPNPDFLTSFTAKFLIALCSKAEVKVYVIAEPSELLRRRHEHGEWFLRKQVRIYEALAESINAFKLDTTYRSVEESLCELLREVRPCIEET
jgi:DNA polymerase III delta prime subunit